MGYRSQVACVISVDKVMIKNEKEGFYYDYDKAKFKEMIGFIKLSKFYELWQVANNADQDSFGWKDGMFVLYGNDWKWYPDYEDVKAFHEMFTQMQDIEGISGYFLRVGEENDDVQEEDFGDDPCYDLFQSVTSMDFTGDEFLGKRATDEEGQTTQDASNTATPEA